MKNIIIACLMAVSTLSCSKDIQNSQEKKYTLVCQSPYGLPIEAIEYSYDSNTEEYTVNVETFEIKINKTHCFRIAKVQ